MTDKLSRFEVEYHLGEQEQAYHAILFARDELDAFKSFTKRQGNKVLVSLTRLDDDQRSKMFHKPWGDRNKWVRR
jgi:hypothetical protein